jgi:asparagine synthase (glutamine-hydrolysing)
MFALALWDEIDRTLVLARDPNGIKPLYYSVEGGYVRFASQARALLTGGALSRDVDPAGLAGFLFWGSVPDPQTLWRSIRAVPAGSALIVRPGAAPSSVRLEQDVPAAGAGLAAALTESIRAHLVADVPVAVFLSSGIDSALLAAVAARHLDTPPVSVTLRFAEFAGTPLDEGPLAARIAGALGLRHVDRLVGRDEFASEWPRILESMDQPSVDGVNTYFVCKAGREAGVKCALSGTGGDELLGGYASFVQVPRLARRTGPLRRVPALEPLWRGLAGALLARRVPKAAGLLRYGGSIPAAYFLRRAVYLPEELPALLGEERAREAVAAYDPVADMSAHVHSDRDAWAQVAELESTQYLRNQLLRDCDWASMAHSLEIRVPFVDARLQAAARAAAYEPARSEGKAAVLRLLAPDLPSPLFTRRKTGFATPAGRWLAPSGRTARAGISSRRLALRVLNHFGIEVAGVPA